MLLLLGVVLVVAESHAPSGILGVLGGLILVAGGILAIVPAGGPVIVAVPVGIALGAAAGAWTMSVTREAARGPRRQIRSGSESFYGRIAIVRGWSETAGQVLLDGTLWRARYEPLLIDDDDVERSAAGAGLVPGDRVVVECLNGLTLCVRRAEEWELL